VSVISSNRESGQLGIRQAGNTEAMFNNTSATRRVAQQRQQKRFADADCEQKK